MHLKTHVLEGFFLVKMLHFGKFARPVYFGKSISEFYSTGLLEAFRNEQMHGLEIGDKIKLKTSPSIVGVQVAGLSQLGVDVKIPGIGVQRSVPFRDVEKIEPDTALLEKTQIFTVGDHVSVKNKRYSGAQIAKVNDDGSVDISVPGIGIKHKIKNHDVKLKPQPKAPQASLLQDVDIHARIRKNAKEFHIKPVIGDHVHMLDGSSYIDGQNSEFVGTYFVLCTFFFHSPFSIALPSFE